jgi:hypothetical protein
MTPPTPDRGGSVVSGHRPWSAVRADPRVAVLRRFLDWARHERGWFLASYPDGSASDHAVELPLDHDRVLDAYATATTPPTAAPRADATRGPDRPRCRVLAQPWYVDDLVDGAPQLVGYELLVLAPDPAGLGRPWEVLGVTQVPTTVAGALDAGPARDAVCAWLRLRAEPDLLHVDEDRVELYLEVTS